MCGFFQFFVNFASSCARYVHGMPKVHRIRTLTLKISLLTVPNNFINEQDTSKKFKASTNTLLQQSRD